MHRAPKCLSRRYDILDNLVKDLTASMSEKDYFSTYADDVPMKMVYDLWNMIKNNPPCEGCPPINQNTRPFSTGAFKECNYQVYSGQVPYCPQKCDPDSKETIPPQVCECDSSTDATDTTETVTKVDALGASNATAPSETGESTTDAVEPSEPDESAALKEESGPRKALALIKSMVASQVPDVMSIAHKLSEDLGRLGTSSDNETNLKVSALIEEQKELVQQIRHLESREKAGIKLLQEADDLWTRMENVYKAKVNEAMQRQNSLKKQHQEAVNSTKKWKNMKKDLESQIETIDRTLKDMNDKYRHKGNDLRTIDGQISNIEKRIDSSKREIEMTEKAILSKKKNSDYIAENYATKIDKIAEDMTQETRSRAGRERDDVSGINKARDELQNVWQQLLQKKLNNEYLRVQKENIISDIASMKKSEIDCKQRCYIKKETLANEINRFDLDIAKFKIQCSRCNKSVDTRDVWNVCTDCPRCIKERECSIVGEACGLDGAQCICVAVKQKFMDNVFENMNAVLQKQIEVGAGKAVGEVVLNCLKHSKNGKVDTETKRLLKEFILTTVRKHLNLTIVGGAVKTRCELDPEAYNKLMLCLKDATVETIGKEDKTTNKKSPCKRWKGTFECHCPKGPKNCVCPQKAPQLSNDPTVYSMFQGKSAKRPYKNGGFCGPERRKEEYYIGKPVAERSEPCKGSTSAAWNVQDVTKVTPLAINESTTSQEQRSSGTSQYGSCKDSDLEKRTQYLKVRSRNEDCKPSNPHLLKPLIHKAKLNERLKPIQPVRQSFVSREVPNKCSRRRDHYLRMPERIPPSPCYINNKKWLSINGQHLETPRGPKQQKNTNIMCDDIIELIDTPSGSPAMAFNKSIIKLIDSKLNGRKTMQVYLRRIGRHRFVLRTSKDNLYGKGYEVATVRKTGSRNLYMDVPKSIIQSTASYTITKTAKHNNSNDSIENNNLCEAVKLCVKTENGELAFVDGVMTTPTSNHINVDLQNVPNLKDFFNKKVPVVELQTKSGTCKLDITSIAVKRQTDKASVDSSCSAHFLKKRGNSSWSKSKRNEAFLQNLTKKMQYEQDYFSDHTMTSKNNNVDLIEVKPCTVNTLTVKRNANLKSDQGFTKHRNYIKSKNGLKDERYKLSVKGIISNEIFEPPAVLRQTLSNNYVLEIDKEYEKDCRNEISKHVLKKYVKILKSLSKHCMHIDVNSKDQDPNKKDGRLLNTLSGNLKLMVINRDATDRVKEADKDYKENKSNNVHVAFKNILCKIFSTSTVQKIKSMTFTDASSESFLQRKYGANSIYGGNLLSKLSSSIKKTTSGAYNLILDKHSKQKFIKNIENLVKKSRGALPISTKAGEIKIQLNKLGKPKDKEYLRLSASGNIFLLINEKTLEELNNDEDLDEIDKRIFEKSVKNLCVAENESLCNESISNCKGSSIDSDSSILVKKCSSYLLDQLYPNTHLNDNISCHQENKSCGIGAQEYQEWFTSVDPCFYYENECNSASYALQRNLSRLDKEIKVLHSTINFKESGVMEYY